jgi:hypothetical protein
MFMMCCIGRRELALKIPMDVVKAYNKMHASLTFHLLLRLAFKVLSFRFKFKFMLGF